MSYHSLSRAITTNPALSLVILSYHPSYNQDFSELWNHPTPSNLSFDNVIPYPVLSRQILPYHFLSLTITNLITKIFFRTLKSPHPFEFILWWRHSLSRAITQILPYHLLSLAITHLITKIFQNSKITYPSSPIWIYYLWCHHTRIYHSLSRAITPNPALSLVILSYHSSYNQDFSELWNHPTPLNLSFDDVSFLIPCYHAKSCLITSLSLTITNLITKSFFRTLKSPHPFEFILWWRHSLSRAITCPLLLLNYPNQDFFPYHFCHSYPVLSLSHP